MCLPGLVMGFVGMGGSDLQRCHLWLPSHHQGNLTYPPPVWIMNLELQRHMHRSQKSVAPAGVMAKIQVFNSLTICKWVHISALLGGLFAIHPVLLGGLCTMHFISWRTIHHRLCNAGRTIYYTLCVAGRTMHYTLCIAGRTMHYTLCNAGRTIH